MCLRAGHESPVSIACGRRRAIARRLWGRTCATEEIGSQTIVYIHVQAPAPAVKPMRAPSEGCSAGAVVTRWRGADSLQETVARPADRHQGRSDDVVVPGLVGVALGDPPLEGDLPAARVRAVAEGEGDAAVRLAV